MDDQSKIQDQIQRCRRLARTITDPDARDSLERLARDYEGLLPVGETRGDTGFDAR